MLTSQRLPSIPGIALLIAIALSISLWSQVGFEPTAKSMYPAHWPAGPSPDSVPDWAKPGRIRFTRWDGGQIETGKAILSGWPAFNPPDPNHLETMTNWYQPETIPLLREARFNLIWVTFSAGFSIESEEPQQEQLRRYIDECHWQGIHVMAYESIANMFWEDMYEHVPQSRNWLQIGSDGKPTPYSAADYTKEGRITRYMADLSNPEWRAYLRRRIDLALDAGADGVIYDNNASKFLFDTYRDIYQYASSRKKDFLLMGNFHNNTYVFNRLTNSITTEDGSEPGIYPESHVTQPNVTGDRADLLAVEGGVLVNNIGLLRIHRALTDGWKPVMVEDGKREVGERFTTPMSAARHKLALAEAMMFGVAMELSIEDTFAHELKTGKPETRRIWEAIGQYNRFFADNEELYTNTKSIAPLAIVLDDRSANVGLLNGLGARNVTYDVIYESDLTSEKLAPYSAIALLTADTVRATALAGIENFVGRGGKLFAAGTSASLDEIGTRRPKRPSFGCKAGRSECFFFDKLPPIDELATALLSTGRTSPVHVLTPKGVVYAALSQSTARGQQRVLVHLLNYTAHPVRNIAVSVKGAFEQVTLLSPDTPRTPVKRLPSPVGATEIGVPELGTYSLLVFEPK
jgi:hypothetical protein